MKRPPDKISELHKLSGEEEQITKQFSYRRIIIIALIAFIVSGYLIYNSLNYEAIKNLQWTLRSFLWILLAFILLVIRHIGYMYRLRLVTDNKFNWRKSFSIISLWEFSSAITPSTVGGAAVAVYFMRKEKLSLGKSAATSMLTIFLDQVFLAVAPLILLLIVGFKSMFAKDAMCRAEANLPGMGVFHNMQSIYFVGYTFFLIIILLLAYGLFINAKALKSFLTQIFSIPGLRKWKEEAKHTGEDVILASKELKNKDRNFWFKAFAATTVSWVSFFMISACVVMAFFDPGSNDISVIFARQFPIWMVMLLPITPGGIGIAEIAYSALMCDFIDPQLVGTFSVVWRAITYYPYLIAGVIILPRWVKRVYSSK